MTDQTPNAEQGREGPWREWLAVGVGLTGLLSIMAVIISLVALSSPSTATTTIAQVATPAKAAVSAPAPLFVREDVKADDEHARRGPDGQWHDAFSHADFTAKAGQSVTVTFANYDGSPHSFTSPSLGLNVTIPAGSEKQPHLLKVTFKAPTTPGSYQWFCAMPCDPWAMAHDGYMRGHVTVTA